MSAPTGGTPSRSELYRMVTHLREEVQQFKAEYQRVREIEQERVFRARHLLIASLLGPFIVGAALLWLRMRGSA